MLHLLKYQRVLPAASYFAEKLSRLKLPVVDLLVAVPLTWARQRERGFNQAQAIAESLARFCNIPVEEALVRRRETLSQAGLTAEERRRNVQGAFGITDASSIRGISVLLVDDILTTGATADACAAALKRVGATAVFVLTVARADLRFTQAGSASAGIQGQSA
jgi:ComF family protein